MFEKHRRRRVIYNDDGDQRFKAFDDHYGYAITDEQSFLDARTTPALGTHVDTYVFCLGNGADPPWGPGYGEQLYPFLGSSERANELIIDACHERGVEAWGSLRMNDIHDSFSPKPLAETSEPIKAEHPEYLIAPASDLELPRPLAERYLWTALNFALPEVRAYRLGYIRKSASESDWDGYELDFTRFVWDFALGEEREHASAMSEFIGQVRETLDEIGERRGRPYTLAVHAQDSPWTAMNLGLDVEDWFKAGSVDVLVAGMGYLPYRMALDEWQALGKQYGVPVYPSVNTNIYRGWGSVLGTPVFHEAVRASSAYYWQQGADGLYIFNLFCQQDKRIADKRAEYIYPPLREIGDPDVLAGKDKLYAIQPTSDSGFCHHGSEATQLPIALDNVERKLELRLGPDADAAGARFRVRAWTAGADDEATVWLRMNHCLLDVVRAGDWYEAEVPEGIARPGRNELAIWCDRKAAETAHPIIVHRVFVPVAYGS
ncbi:hypothetical protein ACFLSJ_01840 [Verrucomicrobiota bacterium]